MKVADRKISYHFRLEEPQLHKPKEINKKGLESIYTTSIFRNCEMEEESKHLPKEEKETEQQPKKPLVVYSFSFSHLPSSFLFSNNRLALVFICFYLGLIGTATFHLVEGKSPIERQMTSMLPWGR